MPAAARRSRPKAAPSKRAPSKAAKQGKRTTAPRKKITKKSNIRIIARVWGTVRAAWRLLPWRVQRWATIITTALILALGVKAAQPLWTPLVWRTLPAPFGYSGQIAPLFTPSVQYWGADIARWASEKGIDPNLLATVMQIESCGDEDAVSSAGAQGLFQVMPFHFSANENMIDPETNAARSTDFLDLCLDYADNDARLAMACYNGGPSVVNRPFATWAHETQRYYVWGATIYQDAQATLATSESLNTWLNAGGSGLCTRAESGLGM
jgi:soluble lytic murein transglycosylase-like protein